MPNECSLLTLWVWVAQNAGTSDACMHWSGLAADDGPILARIVVRFESDVNICAIAVWNYNTSREDACMGARSVVVCCNHAPGGHSKGRHGWMWLTLLCCPVAVFAGEIRCASGGTARLEENVEVRGIDDERRSWNLTRGALLSICRLSGFVGVNRCNSK